MDWIDDTIEEFGRTLGMDDLAFDERGLIQLDFETTGTFGLERETEAVLVYLRRDLPHPTADNFRRALSSCHHSQNPPFEVQPALLANGHMLFAVRIPAKDFQLPMLQRALAYLDLMLQEAA